MNAEVPLRFIDYSNDPKRQNQFLLAISNEQIAKDLYKYGIVPRKEFKLTFPNWLDNDLLSHFIRGYLDGDGFISNNPKEKRANITGTENLLLGIKNILEDQLNIHFSIYSPHNKDTNTRTLSEIRTVMSLETKTVFLLMTIVLLVQKKQLRFMMFLLSSNNRQNIKLLL